MAYTIHFIDGRSTCVGRASFCQHKQMVNKGFRQVAPKVLVQIYKPFDRKALMRSKKPILPSVESLQCGQAEAYERFAADPHRMVVQGGLTRNEHKPERFSIAKGARVPH